MFWGGEAGWENKNGCTAAATTIGRQDRLESGIRAPGGIPGNPSGKLSSGNMRPKRFPGRAKLPIFSKLFRFDLHLAGVIIAKVHRSGGRRAVAGFGRRCAGLEGAFAGQYRVGAVAATDATNDRSAPV